MAGWLTVKQDTFAGHPVFKVNYENDDSNLCTLDEFEAKQLYADLGKALGCGSYDEGFREAQDTFLDWYDPDTETVRQ